jgi:hypothetical protein
MSVFLNPLIRVAVLYIVNKSMGEVVWSLLPPTSQTIAYLCQMFKLKTILIETLLFFDVIV